MVIGRVKFIVSTTLPKPNEVDYWIDILEDPYGSVIRTWNGVEWRRIDQDAVDAIENFSLQLLQLDEKINNTIIELDTLTGEVRVLLDNLDLHITNLDNPHNVTKELIGLDNCDNTSDMDKPISTATLNELNKINQSIILHVSDNNNPHTVTKAQVGLGNLTNDIQVKRNEMGVANGVATLNEQGLIPTSQLPSYVDDVIDCYATYNKADDGTLSNIRLYLDLEHQNAISGESGKIYVNIPNSDEVTSSAYQFRWTGTQFAVVGAPTVIGEVTGTSFDGKRGKDLEDKTNAHIGNISNPHNVTKALIGLLNVDNTSDANKPISNATQSALDNKLNTLVSGTNIKTLNGESLLGSGDILIQSGGVGKVDPNSDGTGLIFNDYEGNKATGSYSHAEGSGTTASGKASHAEGYYSKANGDHSHAEGTSIANGYCSHSEGNGAQAIGNLSHAEGGCSGGGGYYLRASGDSSHVEGYVSVPYDGGIEASGKGSHAEGFNMFSSCHMIAQGDGSHIQNVGTVAKNYGQTSMGCFNEDDEAPKSTSYDASKPALIIGNGTESAAGNAFKVLFNGKTFADGEYSSAGADYAEMFEWLDGNELSEDRVGRFVALKGNKIILASSNDKPIGVISAAPSIIGDAPMRWQGKYLNDEWGRPVYENIEVAYTETISEQDENGELVFREVLKTRTDRVRKINPDYNPNLEYIPRENRKEWDAVGLLGKLLVEQDGTLVAGSFCKSSADGVATKSESGYYVMRIINEHQALILFK